MALSLIDELLNGDSKEIRDLANNEAVLVGFLTLIKGIDTLPDMSTRFYEDSRSLFQRTASGQPLEALMKTLSQFFGPTAKAPGKSLSVALRFDPSVKHLGGIRKDQVLFLKKLKTGSFYGALWPWQQEPGKIEVHLGFCSPSMHQTDYSRLEILVNRFLCQKKIQTISDVGGQIHGISLPSFLQMSEMEGATYTLKVTSGHRSGYLHLNAGSLIAAQVEGWTGNEAAYRIISWDRAAIQIETADPDQVREIHDPLMHVMMESLKIKDEAAPEAPPPSLQEPAAPTRVKQQPAVAAGRVAHKKVRPVTRKAAKADRPVVKASADDGVDQAAAIEGLVSVPFEKATDRSVGKQNQMSRPLKLLIVLGAVIIMASVSLVSGALLEKRQVNRRYDQLMADLAVTQAPDAQIVLLMHYLKANPQNGHRLELEARLADIHTELERRDYENIILDVSRLPVDGAYENKALSLYTAFLTKYPNSAYAKPINQAIHGIRQLLGTAYFEELHRVSATDYLARHAAYRSYLEQFPQGAEREAVERMIVGLAQEYFQAIQKQTAACDTQTNWDDCIAHCDRFLATFSDQTGVESVRRLRSELQDKRELLELTATAAQVADDTAKAKRIFSDYLGKRPETTQREAIVQRIHALNAEIAKQAAWEQTAAYAINPANDIFSRIQRLNQFLENHASGPNSLQATNLRARLEPELQEALRARQADEARRRELARQEAEQTRRANEAKRIQRLWDQTARQLQPLEARFVDHRDGTVTDRFTGLTWSLLDSHLDLGRCISYEQARKYVQGTTTGGHSDWRLPTAGELATLYKNSPFFPGSGAEWYWTSETFARGFHRVVDVVTAVPETVFSRSSKTEESCGAVRAVRR